MSHYYKAPSMKTLQVLHWLDDSKRKEVRNLIKKKSNPSKYISSFDSYVADYPWHERIMYCIDQVIETFGVEAIWHNGVLKAVYCNAGDIYNNTIVYRYDTHSFSVTSLGDLVEIYNWNGLQ